MARFRDECRYFELTHSFCAHPVTRLIDFVQKGNFDGIREQEALIRRIVNLAYSAAFEILIQSLPPNEQIILRQDFIPTNDLHGRALFTFGPFIHCMGHDIPGRPYNPKNPTVGMTSRQLVRNGILIQILRKHANDYVLEQACSVHEYCDGKSGAIAGCCVSPISPATNGDVSWCEPLRALDRYIQSGVLPPDDSPLYTAERLRQVNSGDNMGLAIAVAAGLAVVFGASTQ